MRDAEFFAKYIDYNYESGDFKWRPRAEDEFTSVREFRRWNNRYANKSAGGYYVRPDGYKMLRISVCSVSYTASRIAAVLCGLIDHYDDPREMDHIDGDPTNNKLSNLRPVNSSINSKNRKMKSTNSTGITGVQRVSNCRGWHARISHDGSELYLGYFLDLFEAACTRRSAELQYGYTDRHGR